MSIVNLQPRILTLPTASNIQAPNSGPAKKIPEPTPIKFPQFAPHHTSAQSQAAVPLVPLLQSIRRPSDIKPIHFDALRIHVISNASPQNIIPEPSFLPPVEEWMSISPDGLEAANAKTRKALNNLNQSPGVQTYRERRSELSIDNTAAFRTIRRIPPPSGEAAIRLGNAYEFFKNLELFSGFWIDTSLPQKDPESDSIEEAKEGSVPYHFKTHQRVGAGSQLPPEYRQQLVVSFIKLITYDFGCNVSSPRVEPRLHLTPPNSKFPPSYFNSSVNFICRTPIDRSSARSGIVEGPVASVSCRNTTGFATPADELLDFGREVVAVLLTAQQRNREGKPETRYGKGKWWTTKPRWGGGMGGPIGREPEKIITSSSHPKAEENLASKIIDEKAIVQSPTSPTLASPASGIPLQIAEVKRTIGGINGPSPSPKKKRPASGVGKMAMAIYDNYRKMNPPGPIWDRKTRYTAIGKKAGVGHDDIFLISSLNHHISFVRARVEDGLIAVLDGKLQGGEEVGEDWERTPIWRSRWLDLFLIDDRIEAMTILWGMMAWLMRNIDESEDTTSSTTAGAAAGASSPEGKMDLS
jgi:hypothetical protein